MTHCRQCRQLVNSSLTHRPHPVYHHLQCCTVVMENLAKGLETRQGEEHGPFVTNRWETSSCTSAYTVQLLVSPDPLNQTLTDEIVPTLFCSLHMFPEIFIWIVCFEKLVLLGVTILGSHFVSVSGFHQYCLMCLVPMKNLTKGSLQKGLEARVLAR